MLTALTVALVALGAYLVAGPGLPFGAPSCRLAVDRMLDVNEVVRRVDAAGGEAWAVGSDLDFLHFAECLPVSMKLRGMKLRYFFKQALKNILPAEILTKKKHGFGLPFGLWMDSYGPLRELAHESSVAFSKRGIVRPEFLDEMHRLHRQHPSYYGVMIWVVVMLEQWLQAERDENKA
ncbi:MAG: asparagine synthase-related protein [Candidatus Methylumidiphilus sp.]